MIYAILFLACIPIANWMIGNVGYCVSNGPCVIPILPGLLAPSGVLMVGVALVLRDAVHHRLGAGAALVCIAASGALSALISPPSLALASAVAFLLSELADFAVYAPLRARGQAMAVIASGIVGSVVDTVLFLGIAFGSLAYAPGQIAGKLLATAVVAAFLLWRRRAVPLP